MLKFIMLIGIVLFTVTMIAIGLWPLIWSNNYVTEKISHMKQNQ